MTGWRTLHADVTDNSKAPTREDIEQLVSLTGRITVSNSHIYVVVLERDSSELKELATQYSDAFDLVGIGSGNDTGPGNGSVTFYTVTNGSLTREDQQECPAFYNGLRVEHTR